MANKVVIKGYTDMYLMKGSTASYSSLIEECIWDAKDVPEYRAEEMLSIDNKGISAIIRKRLKDLIDTEEYTTRKLAIMKAQRKKLETELKDWL